ncbi:hypothetical protein H1W83_29165 (plasmid) [Priestia megaterium]|uniref:hypothetical protein n=1 Tax=Priestia megaterium TaxID=1404 RepID=UPI001EDB7544|nr:hypothetical protein [Priestia megaterium]UKJ83741.1 hypothetical protein H1W83_29165 [Priestia megaterium]
MHQWLVCLLRFLENPLWCDKKSLSYSVADATHLDVEMISIQNGMLGNEFVGCMRKCGNRGQMHGPEYC